MASILAFPQIASLEGLLPCLDTPLSEGEWGILALDFDQTLMQAKPTLGDEHFYRFLKKQNRTKGLHADAHYQWTVKVREKIPYETCESVEKINRVIDDFRANGWEVKILTSRGLDMQAITKQHLQMSGLHLTIEDVIFKEFGPGGKLLRKNESLSKWMEGQTRSTSNTRLRVAFADDAVQYCSEVAKIQEKGAVTCFHYIGCLPNDELTPTQMIQLVFQLHAYKESRPIPYEHDASKLQDALTALGMQELKADTLHAAMMQIAALDACPFKT